MRKLSFLIVCLFSFYMNTLQTQAQCPSAITPTLIGIPAHLCMRDGLGRIDIEVQTSPNTSINVKWSFSTTAGFQVFDNGHTLVGANGDNTYTTSNKVSLLFKDPLYDNVTITAKVIAQCNTSIFAQVSKNVTLNKAPDIKELKVNDCLGCKQPTQGKVEIIYNAVAPVVYYLYKNGGSSLPQITGNLPYGENKTHTFTDLANGEYTFVIKDIETGCQTAPHRFSINKGVEYANWLRSNDAAAGNWWTGASTDAYGNWYTLPNPNPQNAKKWDSKGDIIGDYTYETLEDGIEINAGAEETRQKVHYVPHHYTSSAQGTYSGSEYPATYETIKFKDAFGNVSGVVFSENIDRWYTPQKYRKNENKAICFAAHTPSKQSFLFILENGKATLGTKFYGVDNATQGSNRTGNFFRSDNIGNIYVALTATRQETYTYIKNGDTLSKTIYPNEIFWAKMSSDGKLIDIQVIGKPDPTTFSYYNNPALSDLDLWKTDGISHFDEEGNLYLVEKKAESFSSFWGYSIASLSSYITKFDANGKKLWSRSIKNGMKNGTYNGFPNTNLSTNSGIQGVSVHQGVLHLLVWSNLYPFLSPDGYPEANTANNLEVRAHGELENTFPYIHQVTLGGATDLRLALREPPFVALPPIEACAGNTVSIEAKYGCINNIDSQHKIVIEQNGVAFPNAMIVSPSSITPNAFIATFTLPSNIPAGKYTLRYATGDAFSGISDLVILPNVSTIGIGTIEKAGGGNEGCVDTDITFNAPTLLAGTEIGTINVTWRVPKGTNFANASSWIKITGEDNSSYDYYTTRTSESAYLPTGAHSITVKFPPLLAGKHEITCTLRGKCTEIVRSKGIIIYSTGGDLSIQGPDKICIGGNLPMVYKIVSNNANAPLYAQSYVWHWGTGGSSTSGYLETTTEPYLDITNWIASMNIPAASIQAIRNLKVSVENPLCANGATIYKEFAITKSPVPASLTLLKEKHTTCYDKKDGSLILKYQGASLGSGLVYALYKVIDPNNAIKTEVLSYANASSGIALSNLPAGRYFVRLAYADATSSTSCDSGQSFQVNGQSYCCFATSQIAIIENGSPYFEISCISSAGCGGTQTGKIKVKAFFPAYTNPGMSALFKGYAWTLKDATTGTEVTQGQFGNFNTTTGSLGETFISINNIDPNKLYTLEIKSSIQTNPNCATCIDAFCPSIYHLNFPTPTFRFELLDSNWMNMRDTYFACNSQGANVPFQAFGQISSCSISNLSSLQAQVYVRNDDGSYTTTAVGNAVSLSSPNGSIINNANAPYKFQNLPAGKYVIRLTGGDFGTCLGEKEIDVIANPLTVRYNAINRTCKGNDGEINLFVSNAIGTLIYKWEHKNTGGQFVVLPSEDGARITNLGVGVYRYTVVPLNSNQAGSTTCIYQDEVTITEELSPIGGIKINGSSSDGDVSNVCSALAEITFLSSGAGGQTFNIEWFRKKDNQTTFDLVYQNSFIFENPNNAPAPISFTHSLPSNLLVTGSRYQAKVYSVDGCPLASSPVVKLTTNVAPRTYTLCILWEAEGGPAKEKDDVVYLGGINPKDAKQSLLKQAETCIRERNDEIVKGMEICQNPDYASDALKLGYEIKTEQLTLYYYDRAGQLTKTIPPQGVITPETNLPTNNPPIIPAISNAIDVLRTWHPNHQMATTYKYNSLGQLIEQNSPDGNTVYFVHDALGRIRFSEDARHRKNNTYAYTKYDDLGRSMEVGVHTKSTGDPIFNGSIVPNNDIISKEFPLQSSANSEETKTVYSVPAQGIYYLGDTQKPQRNLLNRVSHASAINLAGVNVNGSLKKEVTSYYSYDVHGNVEWLATDIPGLGLKYVAYDYDLLSGKVHMVKYNENQPDQFYHKYEYDADSRIQTVYTSRDGILWDKEAKYLYYAHGPLRRIELGQHDIQGIDYIYTIQGWIKGINSPIANKGVTAARYLPFDSAQGADINNDNPKPRYEQENLAALTDVGKDGVGTSNFAADQFGMAIGYFNGDYKSKDEQNNNALFDQTAGLTMPMTRQLYNGNISTWSTYTNRREATGNLYAYDRLHRIKSSTFKKWNAQNQVWEELKNQQNNALPNAYKTEYNYDRNGNIQNLKRYDHFGSLLDNLNYTYSQPIYSNKLLSVTDAQAITPYKRDLQGLRTYTYDEIGNITKVEQQSAGDLNGVTDIEWTAYNKPSTVIRNGKEMRYLYDAMGNRVIKQAHNNTADDDVYTYHARDAQGNVLSTYERKKHPASTNVSVEYGNPIPESNINFCPAYEVEGKIYWVDKEGTVYKVTTLGNIWNEVPISSNLSFHIAYMEDHPFLLIFKNGKFDSKVVVSCYQPENCVAYSGDGVTVQVGCNGLVTEVNFSGLEGVVTTTQLYDVVIIDGKPYLYTIGEDFSSISQILPLSCTNTSACEGESTNCIKYGAGGDIFWVANQEVIKTTKSDGYYYSLVVKDGITWMVAYHNNEIMDAYSTECLDTKLCQYYKDALDNVYWLNDKGEVTRITDRNGQDINLHLQYFVNVRDGRTFITATEGNQDIQVTCSGAPTYTTNNIPASDVTRQSEVPIYGSDRIGIYIPRQGIDDVASTNGLVTRPRGAKRYELKDHLGNIRVTVSDRKQAVVENNVLYLHAEVITYTDYYPFGMAMPTRNYTTPEKAEHRYGFNGKENDQDMGEGIQDYGFRIYDELVCNWLSPKPLTEGKTAINPCE